MSVLRYVSMGLALVFCLGVLPMPAAAANAPDLKVVNIWTEPAEPAGGQSATVKYSVKNQGDAAAGPFTTTLIIDGSEIVSTNVAGLAAGSTTTYSTTNVMQAGGAHTLRVITDSNSQVTESNEGNNERQESITWSGAPSATATPDLVVLDVWTDPASPVGGQAATVYFVVKNQGDGAAGSFRSKLYIDGSQYASVDWASLAAGSQKSFNTPNVVQSAGAHALRAVADSQGQVAESSESNNERQTTATWSGATTAAPVLSSASCSSCVADSQLHTVTLAGSGFVSSDTLTFTAPGGATYSSTAHPERFHFVSSTQITYDINPGTASGTWNVRVIAPDGQQSASRSFTVNPPFQQQASAPLLSSVSCDSCVADSQLHAVTLTGSGFVSSDTLTFTAPGGNTYSSTTYPNRFHFVSATQITYDINPDTASGTWSVRVNAPDGQQSATRTFYVSPQPQEVPAPVLSTVSCNSCAADSRLHTVTLTGSGFVSSDTLTFTAPGGATYWRQDRFQFISSTQIAYDINPDTAAGTWSVRVNAPDGQQSATKTFVVQPQQQQQASPPVLSSVSPTSYVADSANHPMTLSGSGFVSGAALVFTDPLGNSITGSSSKTTFVSSSQVNYNFNPGTPTGTWYVKVRNPDGTTSNSISFTASSLPAESSANSAPILCDASHARLNMPEAARYSLQAGFAVSSPPISSDPAVVIVAIAWAESGGNPRACNGQGNSPPSWDRGILQINSYWHSEIQDSCAFDPRCAFDSAHGLAFTQWAAYNNGAYEGRLDAAKDAVAVAQTTATAPVPTPAPTPPTSPSSPTGESVEGPPPVSPARAVPAPWRGGGHFDLLDGTRSNGQTYTAVQVQRDGETDVHGWIFWQENGEVVTSPAKVAELAQAAYGREIFLKGADEEMATLAFKELWWQMNDLQWASFKDGVVTRSASTGGDLVGGCIKGAKGGVVGCVWGAETEILAGLLKDKAVDWAVTNAMAVSGIENCQASLEDHLARLEIGASMNATQVRFLWNQWESPARAGESATRFGALSVDRYTDIWQGYVASISQSQAFFYLRSETQDARNAGALFSFASGVAGGAPAVDELELAGLGVLAKLYEKQGGCREIAEAVAYRAQVESRLALDLAEVTAESQAAARALSSLTVGFPIDTMRHVGAVVLLAPSETTGAAITATSQASDSALKIQVDASRSSPGNLRLQVSSSSHQGRLVVLTADSALVAVTNQKVAVWLDTQPVPKARDYADLLADTSTTGSAKYLVANGAMGPQFLIWVPHFSERTIEITAIEEAGHAFVTPAGIFAMALGGLAIFGTAYGLGRRQGRNKGGATGLFPVVGQAFAVGSGAYRSSGLATTAHKSKALLVWAIVTSLPAVAIAAVILTTIDQPVRWTLNRIQNLPTPELVIASVLVAMPIAFLIAFMVGRRRSQTPPTSNAWAEVRPTSDPPIQLDVEPATQDWIDLGPLPDDAGVDSGKPPPRRRAKPKKKAKAKARS